MFAGGIVSAFLAICHIGVVGSTVSCGHRWKCMARPKKRASLSTNKRTPRASSLLKVTSTYMWLDHYTMWDCGVAELRGNEELVRSGTNRPLNKLKRGEKKWRSRLAAESLRHSPLTREASIPMYNERTPYMMSRAGWHGLLDYIPPITIQMGLSSGLRGGTRTYKDRQRVRVPHTKRNTHINKP